MQIQPPESETVSEGDKEIDANDDGAAFPDDQHEVGIYRVVGDDAKETARNGHPRMLVPGRQNVDGQREREGQKAERHK